MSENQKNKKVKKNKTVRNRTRDAVGDYIKTNQQITREYDKVYAEEKKHRKETGEKKKWNGNEKLYMAIIIIGSILIFVRYAILKI